MLIVNGVLLIIFMLLPGYLGFGDPGPNYTKYEHPAWIFGVTAGIDSILAGALDFVGFRRRGRGENKPGMQTVTN